MKAVWVVFGVPGIGSPHHCPLCNLVVAKAQLLSYGCPDMLCGVQQNQYRQ